MPKMWSNPNRVKFTSKTCEKTPLVRSRPVVFQRSLSVSRCFIRRLEEQWKDHPGDLIFRASKVNPWWLILSMVVKHAMNTKQYKYKQPQSANLRLPRLPNEWLYHLHESYILILNIGLELGVGWTWTSKKHKSLEVVVQRNKPYALLITSTSTQ